MGAGHKHLRDVIIFQRLHSPDALSSPVLALEGILRHPFDISQLRHGDHNILTRNQILCGKVEIIAVDHCPAVITVFIGNLQKFRADHSEKKVFISKYRLQLFDSLDQLRILFLQLFSFQTGQSTQTHIYDCLRLCIRKTKAFHQSFFRQLCSTASPDDFDHFIDIIKSDQQSLQDMSSFLRLVQIIPGPSGHDLFLMLQIILQHLEKVHHLRLVAVQCKHIHTESILQLGMLEQTVQNHLCIHIMADIYRHAETFPAGFIRDSGDSFDLFIPHQLRHLFDQAGLVDQIRKLRDHDPVLPVRQSFNIRYCTHTDLSFSCTISLLNTAPSENDRSGRKIRTLDDAHHFFKRSIFSFFHAIVDDPHDRADHFPQIMRRNVGSHTDCDTGSTIYQKIWKTCRQYCRFFFCFIKVRDEINCIFIDIRKHLH